jgi:hypothetical protein
LRSTLWIDLLNLSSNELAGISGLVAVQAASQKPINKMSDFFMFWIV